MGRMRIMLFYLYIDIVEAQHFITNTNLKCFLSPFKRLMRSYTNSVEITLNQKNTLLLLCRWFRGWHDMCVWSKAFENVYIASIRSCIGSIWVNCKSKIHNLVCPHKIIDYSLYRARKCDSSHYLLKLSRVFRVNESHFAWNMRWIEIEDATNLIRIYQLVRSPRKLAEDSSWKCTTDKSVYIPMNIHENPL